ncbi:hypothetical protein Salmuc_04937 [Salipiger mucosus DSM 16094]|uniref:Uncharacterized protein n=1 Tax=Salipiger mucosus DSM 16094 TaxID=1123237 RepID=S9S654_9RHOB|nr:hypothetical protein Salmuc_04937 [Salipiger mucosus DSM 16094]
MHVLGRVLDVGNVVDLGEPRDERRGEVDVGREGVCCRASPGCPAPRRCG